MLGQVASCDVSDFQRAIASANEAQPKFFYDYTGPARGALLKKWYDLIIANKEDSMLRSPPMPRVPT